MKKLWMVGAAMLALGACNQADTSETVDATGSMPAQNAEVTRDAATDAVAERAVAERAVANIADADAADANERLDIWFEDTFMEGARRYPQFLASLGIKERTDEWNDPSREAALENLEWTRTKLEELKANFADADLDTDRRLSYDLWVKDAEDALESDQWFYYRYPFNQMFGAQSRIGPFLINQHRVDTVEDAENYIARVRGVDEYLGEIVDNARTSADMGIAPPKFVYGHVLRDSRNMLSGAPFDPEADLNPVLADFTKKVDALDISDAERERLFTDMIDALQTDFSRGFEAVIAEMERQQVAATTDDGVWKFPDGDAYYADRLADYTTTEMSADEVHQLGLDEVERIQNEMRDIMAEVGFEGDLQEFFEFMRTSPEQVYEDSDAGREAYLRDATAMIDTMKGRLGEVFLSVPKAELDVRRVEAFREQSAGKAFYNRPAADGSRPGIYYANLFRVEDMPKYQMEALAYHEGVPGHHMQFAVTQELENLPKFRKFGGVTAHSEGWGLYSEYLPKEMGFYDDPYSDFGRLAMEIWRAARLVVDTGLHHKRWTREEAIQYLKDNTPNPEGDIVKAIERYIVMPGQATAYKIGMIKILEERERVREALGDAFDIREFHDVYLAAGPVPLDVVERRMDAYVAAKKSGSYNPPAYE